MLIDSLSMRLKSPFWLIMLVWAQAAPGAANFFYASPRGTPSGDGTIAKPWDLATALADNTSPASTNHVVRSGDTIWLRGGTYYDGGFRSKLTGSAGLPITVKPYNGERATIEATNASTYALYVNGSWSTFWGIEIWNSDPNRWVFRGFGLFVNGANTKLINLIVHDVGVGIYCSTTSTNSEIYGGVFYNNGCEYPEKEGQAHSIYVHSAEPGTAIKENIMGNGFGYNLHCYSELGEPVNGLTIEGNVAVNAGVLNTNTSLGKIHLPNFLVGSHTPVANLVFNNNIGYQSAPDAYWNLSLGYQTYGNQNAVVSSNYIVGGKLFVGYWTNFTLINNTFAKFTTDSRYYPVASSGAHIWDTNYYTDFKTVWTTDGANAFHLLAKWQAFSGFDSNSTLTTSAPTNAQIFVRANLYEPNRANIVVINWPTNDNVSVDVSGVLAVGATYQIRNAFDYFASPVASGVYANGIISLPMTNLTVATPVGFNRPPPPTGPAFNVFILLNPTNVALQSPQDLRILK